MTEVAAKLNIPDFFTPELFELRAKWWSVRDNFHNIDEFILNGRRFVKNAAWTRNQERLAAIEAEIIAATNLEVELAAA